ALFVLYQSDIFYLYDMRKSTWIAGLLLFTSYFAIAQQFKGAVMLGFNAAQINGDDMAGYKKLGLTGGAKIIYDLGEKWFPSMEFLYSQRGSRNNVFKTSSDNDIHIDLKYIEIP